MPIRDHRPVKKHSSRRRSHPRTAAKLAWPRFWARQFDYAICWWIAGGIDALIGSAWPIRGHHLLVVAILGPVLVGFLHLAYEVIMLAALGTTLGKSLFGLRVETQRGKHAAFASVLRRSVGAWIRGSYAFLGFPIATLFAWKKSRDQLRAEGLTPWDIDSDTEVTGPPLPMWHLMVGAALAIAAFGTVLLWKLADRVEIPATTRTAASIQPVAGGAIEQPSPPAKAAPANPPPPAAADIGAIRNGRAVFPQDSAHASFKIAATPGRPSATKSAEVLALWAEHTYPYLVADGPERRAMFAWMVAGTRVGMPRGAALALGIDTVISGRDSGHGICWPADLPHDGVEGATDKTLGIRCDR